VPTDAEIDAAILANVVPRWLKVAMVAARSMDQLNLPLTDEAFESVCRRITALVDAGVIDAQGDTSLPRHSEVRTFATRDA
jgi:hypothetical protein